MARPVTLFTGQWADLPLEELAAKVSKWGFDGLELAVQVSILMSSALSPMPGYIDERKALLDKYNLKVYAIGAHFVGQAVCDPIDARHKGILPVDVWGDGEPEGVRKRAAERMKDIARAAAKFGVYQVNGFTGSSIWHMLYSFPPNDFKTVEQGYEDFAHALEPYYRCV